MFKSDNVINTTIPGMQGYKPIKRSKEMQESIDQQKEFVWLLKG